MPKRQKQSQSSSSKRQKADDSSIFQQLFEEEKEALKLYRKTQMEFQEHFMNDSDAKDPVKYEETVFEKDRLEVLQGLVSTHLAKEIQEVEQHLTKMIQNYGLENVQEWPFERFFEDVKFGKIVNYEFVSVFEEGKSNVYEILLQKYRSKKNVLFAIVEFENNTSTIDQVEIMACSKRFTDWKDAIRHMLSETFFKTFKTRIGKLDWGRLVDEKFILE